uniref:Transthyretin-like family protein n=1 Tax=Caenorhabditis tropicalis TaxID=1561998 RepID=A0A1I7UQ59_9PELO
MIYLFLLALLLPISQVSAGADLDVPTNVANRSMSIKGQLFCGRKPFEGAKIRLFRVYQPSASDDLADLLDVKNTYITGMFQVEGDTSRFPRTKTDIQPYVTIHHNCDMDEKATSNYGYKRIGVRLPEDYVTLGTKARKVYDFGKLNLELEFPGQAHDLKFQFKD